jgi:hypothetical protein
MQTRASDRGFEPSFEERAVRYALWSVMGGVLCAALLHIVDDAMSLGFLKALTHATDLQDLSNLGGPPTAFGTRSHDEPLLRFCLRSALLLFTSTVFAETFANNRTASGYLRLTVGSVIASAAIPTLVGPLAGDLGLVEAGVAHEPHVVIQPAICLVILAGAVSAGRPDWVSRVLRSILLAPAAVLLGGGRAQLPYELAPPAFAVAVAALALPQTILATVMWTVATKRSELSKVPTPAQQLETT